ncbi:hypothetical protein OQI89_15720, partial [Lentilactobacillus diolivorans]|uniref:hypothetical protein n=1 Tax=Lentilactobacillus diolivorans TaxID=179838 RepID=UPI0024684807
IMSDKVTNSAIQQELKDGDIDRTISNHAQMMSKAYDNFSSVPLISGNYDYLLFIMLKEVWADIPVPYGSDNFIK